MSYPLLGSHLSISPFGPSNGALSVASVQTRLFEEEEEDGDEKASPVRTAKLSGNLSSPYQGVNCSQQVMRIKIEGL